MKSRPFVLVSDDDNDDGIAQKVWSQTPHGAALKAAARGRRQICLADTSMAKVHIFLGETVPLQPKEESRYTRVRNIVSKPVVSKVAYRNMSSHAGPDFLDAARCELRRMASVAFCGEEGESPER